MEGTDGLDNDNDGNVDDPGEAVWVSMGAPLVQGTNHGIHEGGQARSHMSLVADEKDAFTVYVGGQARPSGSQSVLGKTGPGIESGFHECEFEFTVDGVPERPFYAVEIGKRGSLVYSREELDRQGWHLALTIGD